MNSEVILIKLNQTIFFGGPTPSVFGGSRAFKSGFSKVESPPSPRSEAMAWLWVGHSRRPGVSLRPFLVVDGARPGSILLVSQKKK